MERLKDLYQGYAIHVCGNCDNYYPEKTVWIGGKQKVYKHLCVASGTYGACPLGIADGSCSKYYPATKSHMNLFVDYMNNLMIKVTEVKK